MNQFTKWFSLVLALFFALILHGQEEEAQLVKAEAHPEYVPGEVLVKFKQQISTQTVSAYLQSMGVAVIKSYDPLSIQKCSITSGQSVDSVVEALTGNPDCEYAEPNYYVHILRTPNDSRFSQQWALHNTGQTGGVSDADIDAPEAWDIQTGNRDVIVGIIDTGIDYDHPDLRNRIWNNPGESGNGKENNGIDDDGNGFVDDFRGWDFINNDNDPRDDNEHGTHVAGIIGAETDNAEGVAGTNWDVSLVALKFLGANGSGNTSDAIDAILYAVNMRIGILNNSWGGGGFSQALANAIQLANNAGILFVAAAGNESSNNDSSPSYPASYEFENVVSVASSDASDQLSSFSNFGRTSVDLAAPGSSILSTVPSGQYAIFSGTSMATPYVSGVAALVKARYPDIDHLSLKYRLLGGVDVKDAFNNRCVSEGRLNAANSLSSNPLITTVEHPNTSDTENPYEISAFIVDDDMVTTARLFYTLSGTNSGSDSTNLSKNGVKYTAAIPPQALGTTVTYHVQASDSDGNATRGRTLTFEVGGAPPDDGGGNGGCCGAAALTLDTGHQTADRLGTVVLNVLLFLAIPFYFRKRQK